MRSLETLVDRLNNADALLRVKEQQVWTEGVDAHEFPDPEGVMHSTFQIRHDRELRDGLQSSLQAAEEREGELEQQVWG